MKIYVKILIALAAMSAGVFCYAEEPPVAEQDADSLAVLEFETACVSCNHNRWTCNECVSWCMHHHRRYDGKKMQLRLGVGMSSYLVSDNFSPFSSSDNFLEWYYRDYRGAISSSGSYAIGFQYNLTRTFSLGVDASAEMLWYDLYDSINKSKVGSATGTALIFMPQIRLNYVNRPKFRLYSSFGLGLIAYCGDYSDTRGSYAEDYGTFDGSVERAWQLSLLGFEMGQTFFAFMEAGIGHLYSGLRGGIGYRF